MKHITHLSALLTLIFALTLLIPLGPVPFFAEACPPGCTKPCCVDAAKDKKTCPPGCTKPCCAGVKKAETADHGAWLTDFAEAQKRALAEKKSILVDFAGSDWCGWCIKLDKEVLSQPEFLQYARDNLVLFLADFPRQKVQMPELKAQNQALREKYAVRGFPTVLLLDASGKELARTGYQQGGAVAYVKHLKELLK